MTVPVANLITKSDFHRDADVEKFIDWLSNVVESLVVDFSIKNSRRVPGGVNASVVGLDSVIGQYKWAAQWNDSGRIVTSLCWNSTVSSLSRLGGNLRRALNASSDSATFDACCSIFEWGGERNKKVGARPFLEDKVGAPNGLCSYLDQVRKAAELGCANILNLKVVEEMNSMLTKVHAMASVDGLPIYDSRVAAAIACLVEIYRHNSGLNWATIPVCLAFPAIPEDQKKNRRHVGALRSGGAVIPTPGVIRYQDPQRASRWMSASIRLGWIVEEVLSRKPNILNGQVSRMHAFEACLFMIGYDVKCLRRNLKP